MADLAGERAIRRTLNLMWLPISPERLVRLLLSDAAFLAAAAEGILTPDEQQAILRSADAPWTVDDVPLLDEAAERLGPWVDPRGRRDEADPRELSLAGFGVFAVDEVTSTVAERALEDRSWIYGHVVVDEAQELSRMAWHILQRRAARLSMTIVGDLQQTTHPAGARSWDEALSWARDRIVVNRLRVTYRITRQTAEVAATLLTKAGGHAPDLHPVRDGAPPVWHECPRADVVEAIREIVSLDEYGRWAVIVPDPTLDDWGRRLVDEDPRFGSGDAALDAPVSVITARESKGLEFDAVLLVDPDALSMQGHDGSDVYVAATRATQVLHLLTPTG